MKKWLLLLPVFIPLMATAHGGHGLFDPNSWMHYVGTPEHALPIAGVVVLTAALLYRKGKKEAGKFQ